MAEKQVPNLSEPLEFMVSEQRGRLCKIKHVPPGHLSTLCHRCFRWYSSRLFNALPKHLRNLTKHFDIFLKTIR